MATLYVMSGLPFSGKSTLSKAVSEFKNIPRISFDEVWLEVEKEKGLIPGDSSAEQWQYIVTTCEDKAKSFLSSGKSVVYDDLGSTKDHRDKMKEIATLSKANLKIIYLDVPKQEVIKRRDINLSNQQRHQVSDENFDKALTQFEPPTKSESPLIYNPNQEISSWLKTQLK